MKQATIWIVAIASTAIVAIISVVGLSAVLRFMIPPRPQVPDSPPPRSFTRTTDQPKPDPAQAKLERALKAAADRVAAEKRAKKVKTIDDNVRYLTEKHFLIRVEPENRIAYVNPIAWAVANIDVKRNVAENLAQYCGLHGSRVEAIEIYDYQTGRKVAYLGAWGFEVY